MKVIAIGFPDAEDLTSLKLGDAVTVSRNALTVEGAVVASPFQVANPPPPPVIDGLYNIEKHTP